jgi:hypothetical protein
MPSLLSWIKKSREGLSFSEDFENTNFSNAQGWTAIQGTARNTPNQAKAGLKSMLLTKGTSDSYAPIIKKTLTIADADPGYQVIEAWFYDDMDATNPGPYMKAKIIASSGITRWAHIGVRNTYSTTQYTAGSSSSEDVFASSYGTRSLGWHKFSIVGTGLDYSLRIDGVEAETIGFNMTWYASEVYLCGAKLNEAGEGFGYFDELRVFKSSSISVWSDTGDVARYADLMSSSNALLDEQTISGSTNKFTFSLSTQVNDGSSVWPLSSYFHISQRDATLKTSFISTLMDVNPGDNFFFTEYQFEARKVSALSTIDSTIITSNQSSDGHSESMTYGRKYRVSATGTSLEDSDSRRKLNNFFEVCRDKTPFSFSSDSDRSELVSMGTVSVNGSNYLYINESFDSNYMTNTGDFWLEKADRTDRELVHVETNDGNGNLMLDFPLSFDVSVGDTLRDVEFFPFVEYEGKDLILAYKDIKRRSRNFTLNCVEYIP